MANPLTLIKLQTEKEPKKNERTKRPGNGPDPVRLNKSSYIFQAKTIRELYMLWNLKAKSRKPNEEKQPKKSKR